MFFCFGVCVGFCFGFNSAHYCEVALVKEQVKFSSTTHRQRRVRGRVAVGVGFVCFSLLGRNMYVERMGCAAVLWRLCLKRFVYEVKHFCSSSVIRLESDRAYSLCKKVRKEKLVGFSASWQNGDKREERVFFNCWSCSTVVILAGVPCYAVVGESKRLNEQRRDVDVCL